MILCRYQFACVFSFARLGMHGIACNSFVVMAWVLPGVTMFSA